MMDKKDAEAMKTLVETILLKGMGQALDLGRMSINSDRQSKQFERSMRGSFRSLISDAQRLIDDGANGESK